MKKTCAFLLLSLPVLSALGGAGVTHKATFVEKDIFQSAYFLKNVPGLIADYQGQPIRYFADHDGVCAFLTDQGLIYKLSKKDEKKIKKKGEQGISSIISYTTVKWIGANPHPRIEVTNKNTGYYTFLAGKTDKELHSIKTDGYAKVIYHDLYPGIDVQYTLPEKGGMKYDIIIHPGADVSVIQMEYGGAVKNLSKSKEGNITIHTETGDIMEHAPLSYTGENSFQSSYSVRGKKISFEFPKGYDHNRTLVIDPWVNVLTQMTVRNLGADVDYDVAGDLYVYGAGSSSAYDLTNYLKVAKFDALGNFLWVFMGSVPAASWNTSGGSFRNDLSDIKVDRITNKVYVGQQWAAQNHVRAIRLTSTGVYDNFITIADSGFGILSSFVGDCSTGSVIALSGGDTPINLAFIDTVTGIVTTGNITTSTSPDSIDQDVVCGTYDAYDNLYIIFTGSQNTTSLDNVIYKVNSTYNGYIWHSPSGFNSFGGNGNVPGYTFVGGNTFHNNAMAANGSYLYYYDGYNLKAFDLTNGNPVGTPISIGGYSPLWQGGIAVDNCNNVYVGGRGAIKTFTFNGINFTADADIPLGVGFSGDTINDVRYNPTNNLLYVTGSQIVGTYVATLSTTCTAVNTFAALLNPICNEAVMHVTPNAGLTNPVFSYLWEDSAGNIIRQTEPDTILTDTLAGISVGRYTVQVQLNVNCGGATFLDSFAIVCNTLVHSPDTTICAGQSVTLTASGTPTPGSYTWMPGGLTGQTITVAPTDTTTYTVTYTPTSGIPITDSILVAVIPASTISVNDTTICTGQSAILTANPSIGGGTYNWSPGGATSHSITVSPSSTSTYTVTYSTAICGTILDSGTVTVTALPVLSVTDTTICLGQSATVKATPSIGGGTYSWSPGGATTQSITVSPIVSTDYMVTYSTANCGSAVDSGMVIVTIPPTLSVANTNICQSQSSTISVIPSQTGGTYSWSPGGATTDSIMVSPTTTTVYSVSYAIPLSVCPAVTGNDTVFVTPLPSVFIPDTSVCTGFNLTLSATVSQTGGTYSWSPGGANTPSITITPASTTSYILSYLLAPCPSVQDTATVTVTTPPSVSDSVKNADCTSSDGMLWAVVNGGTQPYSYVWSNASHNNNDTLNGLTGGSIYSVTVTDQSHCTATASGLVGTNTVALAIIDTVSDITCYGLQNGFISVHVPNCGNCAFIWSNNSNDSILTNLAAGTYTVTATSPGGCTDTMSFTIQAPTHATLSITPADTNMTEGSTVMFNPIFGPFPASDIASYHWSPSAGLSCSECAQPVFSASAGKYQYTLVIGYNQGCQIADTVNVVVFSQHLIYIPNSFTPNGDGINDVFLVFPIGAKYISMRVFDRWGEKVFESEDLSIGWDGRFKGTLESSGVYLYELNVTFDDGYSVHDKGSITLIR